MLAQKLADGALFTRVEAAEILLREFGLPITLGQLAHWASKEEYKDHGPKFIRVGKPVYYPERELFAWAERVREEGLPRKVRTDKGERRKGWRQVNVVGA